MNESFSTQRQKELDDQIILIKFGGNAMVNETVKKRVAHDVAQLKKMGASPVVVHGGGPVIKTVLEGANIDSNFVDGHRVTTPEAMEYIEMALSGKVNKTLVSLLNKMDTKAVGISGKDGGVVTAEKRLHKQGNDTINLGFVGNVKSIDPTLIFSLIADNYIPVISPVSMDENGDTYNINADLFAGHMAGALEAHHYVAMTNVDGILKDANSPSSLIKKMSSTHATQAIGSVIKSGMIPKAESCITALQHGVDSAHIINGTRPHILLDLLLTDQHYGTLITP